MFIHHIFAKKASHVFLNHLPLPCITEEYYGGFLYFLLQGISHLLPLDDFYLLFLNIC